MKGSSLKPHAILIVFLYFLLTSCSSADQKQFDEIFTTDILIVGGGTSGSSAAIQAARDGADVVIVEPTPWLGGMLTSAGVSAVDGNHELPSGIWGEFREKLRDHYGGAEALSTGWVSHTLFEPHVGNKILNQMMDILPGITRIHGYHINEALVTDNSVTGATFVSEDGQTLKVNSVVSVDASEYGDLMARSGTNYFIGLDPRERTGEEIAPTYGNDIIQDLTYTAILKDYGPDNDMTIPRPPNYQPSIFRNACKELSENPDEFDGVDCNQMLDYARLPNDKILINWPLSGNDYYLNALEMDHSERKLLYEEAKNRTRQFIYYLQTEGGFKNLGFADDEYDSEDRFPYMPYHRESRRIEGLVMLTLNELLDPYEPENDLYKTAVAVGDYPLDHHRELNPSPFAELIEDGDREPYQFETHFDAFPPIPSFSVPLGSLIPEKTNGLIVAEKSISVSSIANGSSRLQPVVFGIGQAAGVAAAMAVHQEIQPRHLSVRNVQQRLLDAGAWLLPFIDTHPDEWYFQPLQRLGVSGVLKGEGVPHAWANQTFIYPDSILSRNEINNALNGVVDSYREFPSENGEKPVTRAELVELIWHLSDSPAAQSPVPFTDISENHPAYAAIAYANESGWTDHWTDGDYFEPDKHISRKTFAWIIDSALDPFYNLPISIVPEKYQQ